MDDLDHVLKYLREEYQYQIWALVGHSRGKCLILAMLIEGANAAFHYIIMRDRSIPLIVNCSGRFMSELLKTRIESFYPGGLQSGSYIETWALPGGKTRERRTPAEEIISLSNTDNKIGMDNYLYVLRIVAQLPPSCSVLTIFGSADHVPLVQIIADIDRACHGRYALGKYSTRPTYIASHPQCRSQLLYPSDCENPTQKHEPAGRGHHRYLAGI